MIKGVNLGGWFVLESWMRRSLFDGIDSKDETGFMLKQKNAHELILNHYDTWITKDDFIWLKVHGIESIRLPIPWWFMGVKPYQSSYQYIKRALKWADEVGLSVMLDLHTAPGCQNGFDNGGIEGVIDWPKDPKNIDLTIDTLVVIAKDLLQEKAVFAIELLNEPHSSIDINLIMDFYLRSYHEIRKYSDKQIVFHDAFRANDEKWIEFFTKKNLENVGFDLHLYHCFDERLVQGSIKTHIDEMFDVRLPLIQRLKKLTHVYIGEWSLGIRTDRMIKDEDFDVNRFQKLLADMQTYIYSFATGWYFWSYKIEKEFYKGWNFKSLIEDGTLTI
ncbi:MAG TPA: cellulase family glycosylhydrolase [Acholeplasma sp.]